MYVLVRETDADGSKEHWLIGIRKPHTLHGFIFFNPVLGWSEQKVFARPFTEESALAQIALLERIPV